VLADKQVCKIIPKATNISDEHIWYEEFLALKILLGEVNNLDEAVTAINTYSGKHSAAIITEDVIEARQFMQLVDSAAVYHNASTRFTDGGQMGVGAELAISTDKLHHRGPLGLKQLVTNKYYVYGNGQIRV
jgi:glutamate-5-semialdehyde dehydrogenase